MEKVIALLMKKILNGRYDEEIFNTICLLNETDEYSLEEFNCRINIGYSRKELKALKKLLIENILEQLKENHSFLVTARLVEALDCLGYTDKLPKSNKKIQFIIEFNKLSQNHYGHITPVLKKISLLDTLL